MTAPQAPAERQGLIALACGHARALPMADAEIAAELGGLIACPECSSQNGTAVRARILKGVIMPVPDWITFYRERARVALAEYDARSALPAAQRGPHFYGEMAGLLSECVRAWLEATDSNNYVRGSNG